jgi:hypothetical protein
MNAPFIFGKIAIRNNFIDRKKEIKHLKTNFYSGSNTILISPRRWGKSSLVKKAGDEVVKENQNYRVVFIDMFNIRSEEDFYKSLSETLIKAVSGKFEEIVENSKKFFKQWIPKITFSPDTQQEISFGLDWRDVSENPDEILNMAEAISVEKKINIIVCIDEFQNIGYFKEPLAFQKKLRSHWQNHQKTTYCLFGSKRHMLMEFFASPSMPFYKFGDLMFLDKIETKYWEKFIVETFSATGKKISKKLAVKIALLSENHPYYVQQLAQLTWLRTEKRATEKVITDAIESLVLQLSMLFQNITESLSTTQINFLNAVIHNVKQFSSQDTIEKFRLGTSANVIKIKRVLISKEIIDERNGKIEILDPIYAKWLKDFYFR